MSRRRTRWLSVEGMPLSPLPLDAPSVDSNLTLTDYPLGATLDAPWFSASDTWLPANGREVDPVEYPDLAPLLRDVKTPAGSVVGPRTWDYAGGAVETDIVSSLVAPNDINITAAGTTPAHYFAFADPSPDGRYVAVSRRFSTQVLEVVDRHNADAVVYTYNQPAPASADSKVSRSAWSPDGTTLAFIDLHPSRQDQLILVDSATWTETPQSGAWAGVDESWRPEKLRPSFSGDGGVLFTCISGALLVDTTNWTVKTILHNGVDAGVLHTFTTGVFYNGYCLFAYIPPTLVANPTTPRLYCVNVSTNELVSDAEGNPYILSFQNTGGDKRSDVYDFELDPVKGNIYFNHEKTITLINVSNVPTSVEAKVTGWQPGIIGCTLISDGRLLITHEGLVEQGPDPTTWYWNDHRGELSVLVFDIPFSSWPAFTLEPANRWPFYPARSPNGGTDPGDAGNNITGKDTVIQGGPVINANAANGKIYLCLDAYPSLVELDETCAVEASYKVLPVLPPASMGTINYGFGGMAGFIRLIKSR